jgi:pimeloyl-ACP methyl ester carboxylesterase
MDDFRLAYDDHPGGGVPIVLLHGWPGDRQDFRAAVAVTSVLADRMVTARAPRRLRGAHQLCEVL